jgi:hypothetical protein
MVLLALVIWALRWRLKKTTAQNFSQMNAEKTARTHHIYNAQK